MLRNSAAPALYSASIGYDSAESQKYVSAACITSGSTLPNTSRRMCRLSTSTSAPNATKSICAPSRESFNRKEYVVSDSISTPQKKMYVPCPLAAPAYRA